MLAEQRGTAGARFRHVACATRLRERAWGQLPYKAARRAVTRRRCRVATARNAPPAHAHGATGPRFRHPFPPPRCNCAAALQHLCRTTARRFPRRRSCVATPPGYAHRAMRQHRRSLSTPVAAAALQLRCRVATPVTPAPRHRPRGAGASAESVLTPDGAVAPCIARGRSPAPGDAPHHHYHCPAACWGPILLPAAAAILHHPRGVHFDARRPASLPPCLCDAPRRRTRIVHGGEGKHIGWGSIARDVEVCTHLAYRRRRCPPPEQP
ncbi:hypothetical protein GGX14DRAFT_566402 [Mycena pura]|uniref:Uncharacterized protein n=1 Tax=Mycena pura TaxID=153505 RepID=A0AAD6VCP9_9AGAR|nr:hypothetical protein GGX14DRAFT_566402 [Mycena pura]